MRLHFCYAKIKVRLRQAVGGNCPPDSCIRFFESPLRKYRTNKKCCLVAALFIGGLEEIRTPDPHNANVVRSQLRYKPGFLPNYNHIPSVCQGVVGRYQYFRIYILGCMVYNKASL